MAAMTAATPVEQTERDFADFVTARGAALWRSAWLLTGDTHKAEDLVQTALAKAWPHWGRVTRDGSGEPYVRKVLYTTYVTWWRRRWNAEQPTAELPEAAPEGSPPGGGSELAGLRLDVAAALSRLPRGQRAVVVLRYFEDRTEIETARLLGVSVGTVKSQTARALAALRSSPLLAREEDR